MKQGNVHYLTNNNNFFNKNQTYWKARYVK